MIKRLPQFYLSIIIVFLVVSCSPYIYNVTERKSVYVRYKDKLFKTYNKSKFRKIRHKHDHLYYNENGNLIREEIYGEGIGGLIIEKDEVMGSWSGTDYKKVGEVIDYYYDQNELVRSEAWRISNGERVQRYDSVGYINGKRIWPNKEIKKNGRWVIHKLDQSLDSLRLDESNRIILNKQYEKGRLTRVISTEYDGHAVIKKDYRYFSDGDTLRATNIKFLTEQSSWKDPQMIWELDFYSNRSHSTRTTYIYDKQNRLKKKMVYMTLTSTGLDELDHYFKYRYKGK